MFFPLRVLKSTVVFMSSVRTETEGTESPTLTSAAAVSEENAEWAVLAMEVATEAGVSVQLTASIERSEM